MDREYAYKLGQAFKLGMIYAQGKAHKDRKLALDKAEWITVHPNGKENKGRPALIDSTTGQVLGGMGGKFNGQHISIANSKSNKPALLNNQKMGFYDVEKEQEKTTTQYNAMQSKANLNMNEIISNSYIREDVTKGDTDQLRTTIESIENGENNTRIVTPKNIYEFKDNKWTDKDGNTVNKTLDSVIMEDFREFNKSSKYGSEEVKAKAENDTLLASGRSLDPKLAEKLDKKKEQAQEIQKELDKSSGRTHSQRMGDTTRRNKLNKINNEIKEIETQLKDKAKQSKTNQPTENNTVKEGNKISLTKENAIDPVKFKEYNKNVKKEFNKLVKKNQTDKEDFKKFVENMDLDPKFKDIVFEKIEEKPKDLIKSNGERFNPYNNFWVKSPKDIDLNQEVQSYMYFLPSSQTSKMIEDMTEAEKTELKQVIFNENNEKKLKWLQIEPNQNNKIYHTAKIDLQNKYRNELRASGANPSNAQNNQTSTFSNRAKEALSKTNQPAENKTLSANKDNGSVASVLNVPDASKWNNKIYNYRNGEKAVFINNQRIVLNAEQYKKLKELAGK